MKAFKILKILAQPYSDKVKRDFRPLEYIEVKQDKPLIIKLNDKYSFECKLSSVNHMVLFDANMKTITNNIDMLNKMDNSIEVNVSKINCFKLIIDILYEISKNKYEGYFAKRKYLKFLYTYLMDNVNILLDIIQKLYDYNTMLKKKLEKIQNIDILQNASLETGFDAYLKTLIRVDAQGNKYFIH